MKKLVLSETFLCNLTKIVVKRIEKLIFLPNFVRYSQVLFVITLENLPSNMSETNQFSSLCSLLSGVHHNRVRYNRVII
jgi:hypothetical protein